ncbi:hypothetical protein CKM354_000298300 [Cercospora kikuchii]|uniref:Small-subunit processome Utp12 domain-containing protein n=1 Tax=Cercospora kikuchii TaxID=84275 RepID=A0A9P3CAY0_9PEZI|nr:uncharacterized protein CKM354_000298300 [Cercospora kikuchii]GIZ39604.1 hypothetical protein CKM354_000298300 [Cercospora kikuchii]
MSAATKRPRSRPAAPRSASPPPAAKRLKSSHRPAASGLQALVDENARAGRKLGAQLTNGVARPAAHRVDESHAGAANDTSDADIHDTADSKHDDVISISSGEESSDLEEDADDELARETRSGELANGDAAAGGEEDSQDDQNMADAAPADEPTFGDMLQTRHPAAIDVQKALRNDNATSNSLVPTEGRQLVQPPTAGSLGTVLTQALKTNDKDLLESCFAMTEVNAIRATIQRQQSPQIATLLQRIAERIHQRPGRAGRLMIWIQWSLVTHGGYLANQPELMKKLKALARVTRERANGLQPLLHLKGKLDLLSAQLEARRNMQAQSRAAHAHDGANEQDVLYIEGQDTAWSSDDEDTGPNASRQAHRKKTSFLDDNERTMGSDGDKDLPNGFINGVEDDSSADEDDERYGGLVDTEAEEGDSDDQSDDEAAQSDASSEELEESSGEGDSEEEDVKQAKPQTLHRKK